MSIHIRRAHHLNADQARDIADQLAAELTERFDVDHHWEGSVLHFSRTGINGEIVMDDGSIDIKAELGFFFSALQPAVEREINRYLDEHFAAG
jgi:putative polyhydroxyalkanoate system protein